MKGVTVDCVTLHNENNLKWFVLGRDTSKDSAVIDTNEYVVVSDNEAFLMDPGGTEIFPAVLASLSELIKMEQIKGFLCSHQDPDIMSSLPLWLGLVPKAKVYLPWLWSGFVSHFGHEYAGNFQLIPDEGGTVEVGSRILNLVPAHHCHSAGNMHLFCEESGILFTGDMGAALVPDNYPLIVEDFDKHIQYMFKFHQRWMPSNSAKNVWVERVRKLKPKMLCPQHGSIFTGENISKFLDWMEDLEVGKVKKYA